MSLCYSKIFQYILLFIIIFQLPISAAKADLENLPTLVEVQAACGDGYLDFDEVCDPGDGLDIPPNYDGQTCQTNGYEDGDMDCIDECTILSTDWCNTCPNGIREGYEECDQADLNNATCSTFGYNTGTLGCTSKCFYDLMQCSSVGLDEPGDEGDTTGSSGGGGSSGGSAQPSGYNPGTNLAPGETKVAIKGKAYPNSDVHILMDGKTIGIVKTGGQADFYFETKDVTPGVVSFSFWGENNEGIKSTVFSLTFRVVSGAVTTISGIYLAPSIAVDKTKVKQGDNVKIFGQTIPNAEVYIYIHSDEEITRGVESDDIGVYLLDFNTASLAKEEFHTAKSLFQITDSGEIIRSGYSKSVSFYVGSEGASDSGQCSGADLNGDGRVNLVDFSILLFYWDTNNQCADQNHDGKVNLIDFSIMMFNWTG